MRQINQIKRVTSFLEKYHVGVLTAFYLAVLGDVVLVEESSDFIIFGLLIVYLFLVRFYDLSAKRAFFFCFILVGLMFTEFIFTGISSRTDKAAVWLFLFLGVGIMQELWQTRNEKI